MTVTEANATLTAKPGETVWYHAADGTPVSAQVAGTAPNGVYKIVTAAGMQATLRPELVVPPAEAGSVVYTPAVPPAPTSLKMLTICQPYASLIALPETDERHKRVENRTWGHGYRGPLAIHAGKSREYLAGSPDDDYGFAVADLPFGAIVAVADLVDVLPLSEIAAGKHDEKYPWIREHQHTEGPFCFVLQNVRPLAKPVECTGGQGIRNVPEDLTALVWEQVKAVPVVDATPADPDPIALQQLETDGGKTAPAETAAAPAPVETVETKTVTTTTIDDVPDADTWHRIQEARDDERRAENRVASLSEELKHAKKRLEEASLRLGDLIDQAKFPTLFSKRPAITTVTVTTEAPAPAAPVEPEPVAAAPVTPPAEPSDAWRSVPIAEVIPDAKLAAKLADAGITTFGDLEKLRANRWEPKIRGLGEKARTAIDDAVVAYWAAHQTAAQAAGKPAPLVWTDGDGGKTWAAENTAGIVTDEDEPAEFVVAKERADLYVLDLSSDLLMVSRIPEFSTLADAQAWCERRNAELAADPTHGQPTAEEVAAAAEAVATHGQASASAA